MELKLKDGRYSASSGTLETVSGAEEVAQRISMKLAARRGSFWPMPNYGSRLYRLVSGEKPSNREIAVRQYVSEALSDEEGVSLNDVSVSYPQADTMKLILQFSWNGSGFSTEYLIRS